MTEHTTTRARRHTATPRDEGNTSPTYLQLAGDALLAGMTREQAIAGLISRIKRDQGYLAYRKAYNRHTTYDDQVQQDMRALALAAVLLEEQASAPVRSLDGPTGRVQALHQQLTVRALVPVRTRVEQGGQRQGQGHEHIDDDLLPQIASDASSLEEGELQVLIEDEGIAGVDGHQCQDSEHEEPAPLSAQAGCDQGNHASGEAQTEDRRSQHLWCNELGKREVGVYEWDRAKHKKFGGGSEQGHHP